MVVSVPPPGKPQVPVVVGPPPPLPGHRAVLQWLQPGEEWMLGLVGWWRLDIFGCPYSLPGYHAVVEWLQPGEVGQMGV